jgi:DMSO/TMAO reductase YedYZ heme-binding membrane subunit
MYALVVVMVSSWLRGHLSTRLWRNLHLLAVPTFVLALLHGVFGGTDAERPWMMALYVGSAIIVTFLLLVRALTYGYRPPRPAAPERARPARQPATAEAGTGAPVASASADGAA